MNNQDRVIQKAEDIPLTGRDIVRISGINNIMEYGDLSNYTNIDAVLGPQKAVIILYETKERFGHWVCLFKWNNNTLEFFDPLGLIMDSELKFISEYHRRELNEVTPHLTHLVNNSRYNLIENTYKLQEFIEHVNTCGRWTATRIKFRNVNIDEFAQYWMRGLPKIKPDFLITKYTLNL
jgi:hypothetical protein